MTNLTLGELIGCILVTLILAMPLIVLAINNTICKVVAGIWGAFGWLIVVLNAIEDNKKKYEVI